MALRCLLFCSDPETAEPISQVLFELGVEEDACSEGVTAVERVTSQQFRLLIIDWDQQPEAGFLLKTARERKASERPLTLAIVSDDASVPKALQAGANSILRRPILLNQVKDTLTTARDLVRAKENAAQAAAAVAAAGGTAATPVPRITPQETEEDNPLRAAEFLSAAGSAPGKHFDTESEMQKSMEDAAVGQVDALEELEPMAAPVAQRPAPLPPPPPAPLPSSDDDDQPRGLEYYLKARGVQRAAAAGPVELPTPPPSPNKPELLGFDATPTHSASSPDAAPQSAEEHQEQERKSEEKLFAYIEGEKEIEEPRKEKGPGFRIGKGTIAFALLLAAVAVVAAPQAPWHPQVLAQWAHGQKTLHAWLNPQVVPKTTQAPTSHETFQRAGEEYKLPTAEPIPDGTTDPSQIQVKPMVDPTKKFGTDQTAQTDGTSSVTDPSQQPQAQAPAQENPSAPQPGAPQNVQPTGAQSSAPNDTGSANSSTPAVSVPASSEPAQPTVTPQEQHPAPAPAQPPVVTQPEPKPVPVHAAPPPTSSSATTTAIPSSLRSQMASMTPDASGNKPPEAAMQAIEPVDVPELTERGLLMDQSAIEYPANAKGQSGTVILQVLVGRDGAVQDAKFIQGSLAFARAAIDGVKQWKFKPYVMNGRPVSVQTKLTMSFKPGQPGS